MIDKKIVQFRKFEKKSASKGFAAFNEGLFFYNKNNYDKALQKFQEAERLGYKSADLYNCIIYILSNDLPENTKILDNYMDKAIKFDSNNEYLYYTRGKLLMRAGKYEEALDFLLKAEELGCSEPDIYVAISKTYYELKNFLKEMAYATNAVNKYPYDASCNRRKGDAYYWQKEFKNALKYYFKAEDLGIKDSELYYNISYCLSMLKSFKKALIYANKGIFINKTDPFAYYRKGYVYFEAEDFEDALDAYLEAEKLAPKEPAFFDMYERMAVIYSNNKHPQKALEYLDKAMELNKDSHYLHYSKGYILLYDLKKYSEALKEFKQACKYSVVFPDLISDMLSTYLSLKKYTIAEKTADEGLKLFPDNSTLICNKVAVLYKLNRFEEAKETLEKMLKKEPQNDWLLQAYGLVLVEQKQYNKAIEYLEPLENKLADINPYALFSLAFSYYNTEKYDRSLDTLLLYSEKEDLELLETKDKKTINKLIKKLTSIFNNNEKLETIKKNFAPIIK